MKIVGFIPYWEQYLGALDEHCSKSMRKVGGRYLINYTISALNDVDSISETVLFSSNDKVLDKVECGLDVTHVKRDEFLDGNAVTIEQIIASYLEGSDADVIVLLHPNSPFLLSGTISDCIENVVSGVYDSAFTAYYSKQFAWYKGEPLNYSLSEDTPHQTEIEPIILEQSSLYVFSRDCFKKNKHRVGRKPYMKYIDHFEGHDLRSEDDYRIAELIINSGMYSEL